MHPTPFLPTGAPGPWPEQTEDVLADVLLGFRRMFRLDFRQDVLEIMGQSARSRGIQADVREDDTARPHVRELLRAIRAFRDPWAALDSLGEALRTLAPHDAALSWLLLTRLVLARGDELPAGELLAVIGELHGLPALTGTSRHVPEGTPGLRNPTGKETLPELLARLVDRRDRDLLGPLAGFLGALGDDPEVTRCGELPALRRFLAAHAERAPASPAAAAAGGERLIVQIRLDEETPEHVDDSRYRLHVAYYRQPLTGGPFRRVGSHGDTASFTRSELIDAGSARLGAWKELKQAVFGSAGPVRIEFLLPRSMLGYAAELWSSGPTGRPLGQYHPVVVRQLERYTDLFTDFRAWRARWEQLGARGADPTEVLGRIGWPSLDPARVAELPGWLAARPTLACLGLDVPYDQLDPEVQYAVDDAMYLDGMPVLLWRRVAGDAGPLVEALREHRPTRLAELPETVHRYRRQVRGRAADPVHTVTLLWDDPDCVDPDQDHVFPGMVR
ncbi:hypothetical protein ACFVFS_19220 [Kitasatospora sp. NPDC057692]|uniref:VMAP-C domain-containing protein n=1 Tax=Kitasatospora sp. NPDC057692 TaxID=3346215 RepID=UPI0036CA4577